MWKKVKKVVLVLLLIIGGADAIFAASDGDWLREQIALLDSARSHYVEYKKNSLSFGMHHTFTTPSRNEYEAAIAKFDGNMSLFPGFTDKPAYSALWREFYRGILAAYGKFEKNYKSDSQRYGMYHPFSAENGAQAEAFKISLERAERLNPDRLTAPSTGLPPGGGGASSEIPILLYNLRREIQQDNKGNALHYLNLLENRLYPGGCPRY